MGLINVILNPSDKVGSPNLSNGDLTFISTTSSDGIRANKGKSTGRWYWEVRHSSGNANYHFGLSLSSQPISNNTGTNYRGYYAYSGAKYPELTVYGTKLTANDIISVLLDLDNGILEFWKNGVSLGVSHTDIKTFMGDNQVIPYIKASAIDQTVTFNFGATLFAYPIPNGYQPYAFEVLNKFLISSEDDDKLNSLKNNGYTNNIVPVMTSNTSPQGVASSSTFTSTREPWRAFDGELIGTANAWQATTNATTGYLSYRFVDKKVINQYAVTGLYQNPTFSPKNWTFEGSNDGISWTVLDTRSNITNWSPTAIPSTNIYTFDNNIAYYYYRINVTANGGAANLGIQELQMMEQLSPSYVYIDNKNENMFLNHGLDKNSTLELYLSMKEKKFINTTPQTIGSGKVFKQKIDTTNLPIKKASIT
ncbi:SPRY domain-containing protein [Paenibacillus sp. USHLN196]|uniref:SPRY domain-containing protein n=1 Tax=Paenibacillus sp. USHLN196 TaxID=3081291 RepID=UPI0030165535